MENYKRSYDSLAKAAEEIFNRDSKVEADPEPLVEEDVEDISSEELEESAEELAEAFRDSVEATDYMERILGTLKNRNLESWAKQTDRNYSVKSVKALKKAIDAYDDFLELMYSVDEALTEGESLTEADLEEAKMSQGGAKTAGRVAAQIYSLEKSLKVGSNLNKGVNKSLEGKYDGDFKKMEKSLGEIIDVWEEIERDFANLNEWYPFN